MAIASGNLPAVVIQDRRKKMFRGVPASTIFSELDQSHATVEYDIIVAASCKIA